MKKDRLRKEKRYSDAYVEMAMAGDRMNEAVDNMEDVITESGGMSHTLDDSLNAQQLAMEAIAAAIQALQPPRIKMVKMKRTRRGNESTASREEKAAAKERSREKKKQQNRQQNLWQRLVRTD